MKPEKEEGGKWLGKTGRPNKDSPLSLFKTFHAIFSFPPIIVIVTNVGDSRSLAGLGPPPCIESGSGFSRESIVFSRQLIHLFFSPQKRRKNFPIFLNPSRGRSPTPLLIFWWCHASARSLPRKDI